MVINLAQVLKENTPVIKETPLKWSTVTLLEMINRGKRLEASVFDIEAKIAWKTVINGKYSFVNLYGKNGMIKSAFYPGRFKRIYCEFSHGFPFFLPSQMNDIQPKSEKYISKLTKCSIDDLKLNERTLLMTRSGTIGNIALVSKTLKDTVFSDDVIRISFNNEIDLGYVYTFLKTNVGNKILQTNGYGSVITHLEPEHLQEIPIPNAPNEIKLRIHNLIINSYSLRDESNKLLDEAKELLIKELKLPPINEMKTKRFNNNATIDNFIVKLSQIKGRIDASYHVPIVDAIIKHLQENAAEVTTIGDSRISKSVILPGRFKRIYVDESYGRVFIGGKQLFELDPSNKKYLSLSHHAIRIKDQLELHENMTLITCSGTIGKVTLTPRHWEGWTANQHIIRVIPTSDNIAGYLSVFLASDYGYELISRFTYGSVVDEIDDSQVSRVPIPILKNADIQNQINGLALQANEKRYQAYLFEQEALQIMDDEVIYAK